MELILMLALAPFVILIGVAVLSTGECYECGAKLESTRISTSNVHGKKICDNCWVKGK